MEGHRRIRRYCAALALACLSGCAYAPPTGVLPISTEPAGALAWTPDGATCRTPCDLEIRLDRPVLVNLDAEGYEPIRNILVLRGPDRSTRLAPGRLERILEPAADSRLAERVF
jgi:hypothetical protein